MRCCTKLLSFLIVVVSGIAGDEAPVVQTALGAMRGYYLTTRGNRSIVAFTSVPYARPPLGDLRFKAPQPVEAWSGVLETSTPSPACVQRNPYIHQKEIIGQEDCLYLNLYTPRLDIGKDSITENLLPVMVFIHGGGWMCGDSSTYMYGPEFLLDRDVLLVAMNYRLGPLGFLSTQDEHCPGNNGLKDQQAALRWIQENIANFGGNPNSVTIFGESAGGASVHYHMISPTSAGLFHKAISESGAALVPWAEAPPGEPLTRAFQLAKFMDCPQAPSEALIDCLREKDAYELIDTEFKFYVWNYAPMTPFKAVAEPDLPGAFLTKSPRETPDVPAVPWMTGLNSHEGCLLSVWITTNETLFNEFFERFDELAPVVFYYENSPDVKSVTKFLREKYFDSEDKEVLKKGLLDAFSDLYFAYPALDSIQRVMEYTQSPVYLYELAYRATNSFSQIFGDPAGDYGVCHADELMHLFPIYFLQYPMSEEDIKMSNLIIDLWTNFATSGNPNTPIEVSVDWQAISSAKKLEYLKIGKQITHESGLAARSHVWGELPLWHKKRLHSDEL